MCACEMSISSPAPYTSAIRTRIDIASCGAGPWSPFSISRSRGDNSSIAVNYNPRMRKALLLVVAALLTTASPSAQNGPAATVTILEPARVFDGDAMHEGWAVRVKGERIDAVGPAANVSAEGATVIDLPGTTLTPGLVEG